MSDTFIIWAPWVFTIIAGILGYLIRWGYDDKKIKEYEALVKTKEEDLYHLNEAHNLLLKDKEKKIADFHAEKEIKDRTIRELTHKVEQGEISNKTLLSQVVDSKKKKALSLSSYPSPAAVVSTSITDTVKKNSDKKSKKKEARKKYKKQLKKLNKIVQKLRNKNERMLIELNEAAGKSEQIIKEIPITIEKTILRRERVDRKKLKKYIKQLPLKKSRKVISKKIKKGKSRIVSED